jgi:hypothetical protein
MGIKKKFGKENIQVDIKLKDTIVNDFEVPAFQQHPSKHYKRYIV